MKRVITVILSFIFLLGLSACWSRKEPKALALINSVLYDLGDTGLEVTLEIRNPSASSTLMGSSSGNKSPFMTITGKGPSVAEAIRDVSKTVERTLDSGHNKARYFSKKFAEKDMYGLMDYLLRDHLTDESPFMVVIKNDDPKLLYKASLGLSNVTGDYIESLYKEEPKSRSKAVFTTTLEFVKEIYTAGKQPVAGLIEIVEDKDTPSDNSGGGTTQGGSGPKYKIEYQGLAAFKGNKLIGFLNGAEARAYNFINDSFKGTYLTAEMDGKVIAASVDKAKCKVKAKKENGKITLEANIKMEVFIVENEGTADLSKQETVKAVGELFNSQIKKEIEDAVKRVQTEYKSDIFGFGNKIHSQLPKDWKDMKDKWDDDYFPNTDIKIKVESDISRTGEISKSVKSGEEK